MGDSYLALPRDPQPWIIEHLIPVGGLTNIYGKPKTGKSYGALGMAIAIANGDRQWLGTFPIHKHGPVAYFQIDTPRSIWAERLEKVRRKGYPVDKVAFGDMLMSPFPFDILNADHAKWLKEQFTAIKPMVAFIDTLREIHRGDENDSTQMSNVINALLAATRWDDARGPAVVLVSHQRKDTAFSAAGGDDLMSDARGSSYVAGRMDTVIRFTRSKMEYQGRSVGRKSITVQQSRELAGMHEHDPKEQTYWQLVERTVRKLRKEDPTVTINAMATAIESETTYRAIRTITEDVKEFLLEMDE